MTDRTGQAETWWGIRKTGTVGFDTLFRVEHWSEADAIKAAAYTSERWGPYNVVPPVTTCTHSPTGAPDEHDQDRTTVAHRPRAVRLHPTDPRLPAR